MNLPQGRDLSIVVVAAEMNRVLEAEVRRGWYDVLRMSWLDDCLEIGEYLEPSPWHYLYMKPETRQQRGHHDMHGDPWFEDLDEAARDMQQLLNVLLDQQHLQQLRAQLEKADKQQAKQQEAVLAGTGGQEGHVMTRQVLMDDIDRQLEELGQHRAATSLLHGKVVFFLDMWASAIAATSDDAGQGQTGNGDHTASLPRLEGVADAELVAGKWQKRLHVMQMEELRMQLTAHGGEVQTQLAPGVTHIVLIPPGWHLQPPSVEDGHQPSPQQLVTAQQVLLQLHDAAVSAAGASLAAAANKAVAASKDAATKPKGSRAKPTLRVVSSQLPSDLAGLPTQLIESVAQGTEAGGSQVSALAAQRAKRLLAHVRKRLLDSRVALVHPSWATASCTPAPTGPTSRDDGEPVTQHSPWVMGPQQLIAPMHAAAPAASCTGAARPQTAGNAGPVTSTTLTAATGRPARATSGSQAARPRLFLLDDDDDDDMTAHAAPNAPPAAADDTTAAAAAAAAVAPSVASWSAKALPLYAAWPWSVVGLAEGVGQGDTTCSSVHATTTATDSGSDGGGAPKSQRGRGTGRRGRGRGVGTQRGNIKDKDTVEAVAAKTEGVGARKATRKRTTRTSKSSQHDTGSDEQQPDDGDESGDEPAAKARKPRGRGRGRARGGRGRGTRRVGGEDGDVDDSDGEADRGKRETSARKSRPPGYKGLQASNGKRPRVGPAQPSTTAADHTANTSTHQAADAADGDAAPQQLASRTGLAPRKPVEAATGSTSHTHGVGSAPAVDRATERMDMERDAGVFSDSGPSYHSGDLQSSSDPEQQPDEPHTTVTSGHAGLRAASQLAGDMQMSDASAQHLLPQEAAGESQHHAAAPIGLQPMAGNVSQGATPTAAGPLPPFMHPSTASPFPATTLPSQTTQQPTAAQKKRKSLFLVDSDDEEEEAGSGGMQHAVQQPFPVVPAGSGSINATAPTFPATHQLLQAGPAVEPPSSKTAGQHVGMAVGEVAPGSEAGSGSGSGAGAGAGPGSSSTQAGTTKASAADFLARMGWIK